MKNWTGHHFNELNSPLTFFYYLTYNVWLKAQKRDLWCGLKQMGGDYISSWLQVTVRTVF